METRILGRTGLAAGAIGLGTEYLIEVPRQTVVSVVREAVDAGVNYLDVLFAFAHYRDNFGAAIRGFRDRLIVAGHLGSAEQDGQYRCSRDVAECEALIDDQLRRLRTDFLDVLFISNCDEEGDYARITGPGGLWELAEKMRRQGKARFVGFSGHTVPVSRKAVESGGVDVLMHSINLSADEAVEREGLYHLCAARRVGLVGMKPFAGGSLLQGQDPAATPLQCLSYVLSRPGVSVALPGVKDLAELRASLAFMQAGPEEKDFSANLAESQGMPRGVCVYCNHCLPCPAGIDVGKTTRLLVSARQGGTAPFRAAYNALPARASACTKCGACAERCPFGVDAAANVRDAAALFEQVP